MLKNKSIFFLVGILTVSCSDPSLNKPLTHSDDLVEVIHGKSIADPYRWLEDFTSNKAKSWEDKQNKYTNTFIESTKYKKLISKLPIVKNKILNEINT